MPILNDLLTLGVIGPAILQGREEGRLEAREEGRREGCLEIIHPQLTKRFGSLPA